MNTLTRALCISHLCLAFSALLIIICTPFGQEAFQVRFQKALYESLTKGENHQQFQTLTKKTQDKIRAKLHKIQSIEARPLSQKIHDAFYIALYAPSPFTRAWIFFSILIPILILRGNSAANATAWLLPALALAFFAEQLLLPQDVNQLFDFRTAGESSFQYLLRLADEIPPYHPKQVFTYIKRAESPFLLGFYLIWNFSFAIVICSKKSLLSSGTDTHHFT